MSCSKCNFTSQFESALSMHNQLHHDGDKNNFVANSKTNARCKSSDSTLSFKYDKVFRAPSATRLFDKLRARLSRSKTTLPVTEGITSADFAEIPVKHDNSLEAVSDCTSKDLKAESSTRSAIMSHPPPVKDKDTDTYSCHLCKFAADRITVLDRHLLNDHKIGLENLLKLVMAKTKVGLTEPSAPNVGNIRTPYYQDLVKVIADEEFIMETVAPKIKIMKHAASNTDLKWKDIPNLKDNCQMITKELEKLMKHGSEKCDKDYFLEKMQTLNEYMCKFMDTSNTLKKTLTKEFGSRNSIREHLSLEQPFFDLTLGERDSPQDWERTHSEKTERSRLRAEKKLVAESFYF